MKPTKNRFFCVNSGRIKMLFDTEQKANRFIEFNGDDVPNHNNPLRAYYCSACGGWHITKCRDKKIYHDTDGMMYEEIQVYSRVLNRLRNTAR